MQIITTCIACAGYEDIIFKQMIRLINYVCISISICPEVYLQLSKHVCMPFIIYANQTCVVHVRIPIHPDTLLLVFIN
jgi:hypothetical protein